MNTCVDYLESEKNWSYFIENADENDLDNALYEVSKLQKSFYFNSKSARKRMKKMFFVGVSVYERRFKKIWIPF